MPRNSIPTAGQSTRGDRRIHTPAGRCPAPLTATDAATVRAWTAEVIRIGRAAGVAYSGAALQYWARTFYPPDHPDYRLVCGNLAPLFGPNDEPQPELFTPAATSAECSADTGTEVSSTITVKEAPSGDAAGSAAPGSPPSTEPAAAAPDLPPHPACALLPDMTADEYEQLKADIQAHGQREPIRTCRGQLLDGRHRYRACRELGIEPRLEAWDGPGSPITFVLSANVHRRHMTTSQRSMIAGKVRELFQAEAQQRMRAGKPAADPPLTSEEGIGEERGAGEAAAQAARLLRVGTDSVYKAAKVQASGVPELQQAVTSGAVSVSAAAALAGRPAKEQKQALRQGGPAVHKAAREARQRKPAAPAAADAHGSGEWPQRVDRLVAELVKRYTSAQLHQLVRRLTATLPPGRAARTEPRAVRSRAGDPGARPSPAPRVDRERLAEPRQRSEASSLPTRGRRRVAQSVRG